MYFVVKYFEKGVFVRLYRVKGDTLFDIWSKLKYHLDDTFFTNLVVRQVHEKTFNNLSKFEELL